MDDMELSSSFSGEPPEPMYECECCGYGIYPGDLYYSIGGEPICFYCARNCEIVLRKHGGVMRQPAAPICDICKLKISEEYVVFRGKNYCKHCISCCGENLTHAIFKANWNIAE